MFSQTSKDYLVALIRAQLRQETVPALPADLDLQELYKLAKKHCVESIVYYALEQLTITGYDELLATWAANRDGNLFKLMTQLGELERLSAVFEEQKIKHLPLKGPLMVEFYPQIDFRYLGDLDILVTESDLKRVSDYVLTQGYRPYEQDFALNHQEYQKDLGAFVMDIEIHDGLMGENQPYYPLYEKPWDKMTFALVQGYQYRYQMSNNDFYIFHLVHLAKHYFSEGSGIRSLMDIYVYLKANAEKLDFVYIDEKLNQVNLKNFRQDVEKLTEALFGDGELTADLTKLANKFLDYGAYGSFEATLENRMEQADQSRSKLGYALGRFFLPVNKLKGRYPILQKHPYLLPYFWLRRIVSAAVNPNRRRRMQKEVQRLREK